ncbi:MAG: hypothetical protein IT362_04635 [Deltaproteobacteria bacterium]|nr:hypothetical protein [Deltaproteobacteria bacterium]
MSALGRTITLEFCKLCGWAHNVWVIHRTFEDNLDAEVVKRLKCPYVVSDLSIITLEYCLLQIAKLHDNAVQNGNKNLTISYVLEFGGWDEKTRSELCMLASKLEKLRQKIKPARNKILSHNDLETILNDTLHGKFCKDADIEYFNTLQEFVNVIHDKEFGGPYPLENSMAKNDALILVDVLMGKLNPLF